MLIAEKELIAPLEVKPLSLIERTQVMDTVYLKYNLKLTDLI